MCGLGEELPSQNPYLGWVCSCGPGPTLATSDRTKNRTRGRVDKVLLEINHVKRGLQDGTFKEVDVAEKTVEKNGRQKRT